MVLIVALGLRVGYVATTSYHAVNDAGTYNRFAASVATDGDYTTHDNGPGQGAGGSRGPTAYFPPAYPYTLAIADLLDGHTAGGPGALTGERLEGAALGTVTVALTGLVALELTGAAGPGLAALGLAAVYPPLIELSGVLAAENLLVVFELAAVWAGLRAARGSPRRWWWITGAGVCVGLATLAHENAALMLLALAVPAAAAAAAASGVGGVRTSRGAEHQDEAGLRFDAPPPAGGHRHGVVRGAAGVALLCVCAAAAISPWTIRNALQLHHFVPVSDETGITLRGTYNAASAASEPVPYKWRYFWHIHQDFGLQHHAGDYSELGLEDVLERQALHYIAVHPSAPWDVGSDNLKRMFELEGSAAWQSSARAVDLPIADARIGVVAFWVLCALALAGLATRAVRAGPKWPWLVPVLFALSVVFVNVETPRFREPIDPFLLVLAGCAVSAAWARMRSSRP